MSVKFEDALDLEYIDGRNWLVTQDFFYDTDIKAPVGSRIEVPKGFVTDFASIPRVLWNVLPPTGGYGKAAVIHDLLYRTAGLATRPEADSILLEAMTALGVGRLTRYTIYSGVRVGGFHSYHGGL